MIESGSNDNSLLADLSVECRGCMSTFEPLGETQVLDLIRASKIKSCALDPLPASLMLKCCTTTLVPILKRTIIQSLPVGEMPHELKTAMLLPLLKKANAYSQDLANYRPETNLKFVLKLILKGRMTT